MTLEATPQPEQYATTPPSPAAATGRWTTALVVVGVAIAAIVFALVVLAGLGGSSSTVARWVPADTTAYAEVRLDLPGDQEANLASFLGAFPGFDDTSLLPDKLAEAADRLLGAATGGGLDYSTEIAPWFGGQVGLASSRIAPPAGGDRMGSALFVATVTDATAAAAWAERTLGADGRTDYEGVSIVTTGTGPLAGAWAITNGVLLLGDGEAVRAAIDTGGSSSFASRSDVTTARRELGGDQTAFWFVDATPVRDLLEEFAPPSALPLPSVDPNLVPAWIGGGLRFESGTAVATTVVPHREGESATNAQSAIPDRVPATTVLLLDGHDVGARLAALLDSAGAGQDLGSVEGALRLLGGADGLVGWISELAVVVDAQAGGPSAGLVAISSDPSASQSLFTQLEVAARLAGGEVTRTEEAGIPVVSVTLTGLDRLLGGANLQIPGGLPSLGAVSLSWAESGDLVVIGADPAFVRSILATTGDTSLASNPTFTRLLDQAGRSHVALGWLEPRAALRLASSMEPGLGSVAGPDTDAAQYLAPLDGVLGTFVVGGPVDRSTVIVSVTEPS